MIFLINRFTLKDQWFDSHRLPKSNMAPRGFWNLPLHLKNKLWKNNYYILMFLICCLRFICIFVLIVWKSPAFCSWDISGILWGFPVKLNISVENHGLSCPYETSPHSFAREKVGSRYGGALFFSHTDFLGTNAFVLKINFLLPILFDRCFQLRTFIEVNFFIFLSL